MIICIDSGNSRIKWGVHDGRQWLAQGAAAQAEVAGLAGLVDAWPVPNKVLLANVAGDAAAARIRGSLAPWAGTLREVRAEARRCGVTNGYADPAQLGVDRWCALIGARGLSRRAALVVMAGTATTIDSLDADGNFLGGLILPGIDAMRRALARDTAALPFAEGAHDPWPRCTADAIVAGAIEAQAGAVERAFARLAGAEKCCLVSGGNANVIASQLVIKHVVAQNLVLEGLKALALEP